MAALPTGTVTFLFTDIEGSTRLAQELGDAWPGILERHNALLSAAVESQQGIQFGSEGDSVFAVFASAPPAVAAAVDAQRALAAEAWPADISVRVRMGLHTGEGQLSGASYVGIDVHRVARIANAGHGGQVLLSGTTRMLVEGSLTGGTTLRELGEHRLKDLSRPERLAMLVVDGLPSSFPPPRTLDVVPNNLPTQLTTFLGRERELTEAGGLLREARLLTLTGPGGTGKTRLSLQLAADATDAFPDGVFFVPLGPLHEPGLVLPTISQALGMPDPGAKALDRVAEHLAGKRILLVLDNFEQVIDAAATLADLLGRAPGTVVLATSRSPLRIYGEQEYPVPPLSVPDPRHLPDFGALSQFSSVALFIERAMAVRPGFRVDASNAPAIAEICARLDGLPLAIELAAARVRVLTPQAIMARLGDRLSLLAGGSRNLPERQQTLRGAIDWSHDLLEPPDRVAFARFSAFAGGADVPAVEQVLLADWPADAGPAPDALDTLTSLLDKSLVRQEMADDGEPRFRMLETIRDYAEEKLDAAEPDAATRLRHAEYYLALAEGVATRLFGPDQRSCLDTLEREHDNLRGAISFAITRARAELAMRLLTATWRFWQMRGYLAEGREQAERVLALDSTGVDPTVRGAALEAAGGVAYWQADMPAAGAWYAGALEIARASGDDARIANALYNMIFTYSLSQEDLPEARVIALEAVEIYRRLGDEAGLGRALWGLSNTYYYARDSAGGLAAATEGLEISRRLGDRFMTAWSLYMIGLYNLEIDRSVMRGCLEQALPLFLESDDKSGYALTFDGFASLEWAEGDVARAMRLAGYAAATEQSAGTGLAKLNREFAGFDPETLMDQPPLAAEYAEGQRMTLAQATDLALHREQEQPRSSD